MTVYENHFATQADGLAVDGTNSATTGTPIVVASVNGSTYKYSTTSHPKDLTRSILATPPTAGLTSFFKMVFDATYNIASSRLYFCFDTIPLNATNMEFMKLYSDLGGSGISAIVSLMLDGTNRLRVEDCAGAVHSSITTAGIVAGAWYYALPRVTADAAAGEFAVDFYKDSDDTLLESKSFSGFNTRGGNITEAHYGYLQINGPATMNIRFAGLMTQTNTLTPLPRYSTGNVAPTANAGLDMINIEPGDTITLDGSGSSDSEAGALTYAWSQVSGTTTALSSNTAQKPTFIAPATVAGTTLVYQLVVTDPLGGVSAADQVSLTILPTTVLYRVGGVLVPAQLKVYKSS